MPDQLQLRGGTTTEHNSFTGVSKEVTVDTTKKTLVVHDGSTAGGNPLMKENGGNAAGTVNIGTGGTNRLNISSSEIVFNESGADTDFRIEGDSSADLFKVDAGNNRIGIGTPTPDQIFTVRGGTDTVSIQSDDHPTSGQNKGGILGLGGMMNGNGTYHNWAELRGLKDNNSNNQNGGYLTFYTTTNGQSIAERMRITSGGNVGIGTATPARPLEIVGTVRVANDSAVEWGGTTTSIAGSSSSNTLFFTTNSGEKMRITSAGNVGIGGTAPNYQLHVVSNMAIGGHGFAQQLTFSSTAIQSLLLGTGYTNMSINALGGNVGIGTTTPGQLLSLKPASGQCQQSLTSATNQSCAIYFGDTDSVNRSTIIHHNTGDYLAFGTAASERMRINSSGCLSVGTTDTSVAGNNVQGISLDGPNGYFAANRTGNESFGFGRSNNGQLGRFFSGGTNVGSITVGTSTTAYNTSMSDRSKKKNFEEWTEDTLSLFKNLNPQRFNYKTENDSEEKTKGFIAQDLVDSFPEAYPVDDKDDKYWFNPSGMTVYLMKAMQEAITKIETLETKLAALEAA